MFLVRPPQMVASAVSPAAGICRYSAVHMSSSWVSFSGWDGVSAEENTLVNSMSRVMSLASPDELAGRLKEISSSSSSLGASSNSRMAVPVTSALAPKASEVTSLNTSSVCSSATSSREVAPFSREWAANVVPKFVFSRSASLFRTRPPNDSNGSYCAIPEKDSRLLSPNPSSKKRSTLLIWLSVPHFDCLAHDVVTAGRSLGRNSSSIVRMSINDSVSSGPCPSCSLALFWENSKNSAESLGLLSWLLPVILLRFGVMAPPFLNS
mmetsp:Transcript_7886/g.22382  ORF Transcript_7886/g.22382 Transcript_7886/m.22382 type:complete len:266 (-) Transcript_7886:299-1096(-)